MRWVLQGHMLPTKLYINELKKAKINIDKEQKSNKMKIVNNAKNII
jgi:hypothetical protein